MISYCRPISHPISKHIRTFFSTPTLLVDKKPYKIKSKHVGDYWSSKTKSRHMDYRMIQLAGNVRIMELTNPQMAEDIVYCFVRIGVGSNDDPDNYLGLAHLLEHAVTTKLASDDVRVNGQTMEFMTLYSLIGGKDDVKKNLPKLSDAMFSPKFRFYKKTIERECKRVDMEFQEGRRHDPNRINLIAATQKLAMRKFAAGNLKTLWKDGQHTEELIDSLKNLRTNCYGKRQVFVCIYSQRKLLLKEVFNLWASGPTKLIEAVDEKLAPRNPEKKDFSQKLFVVNSDDDSLVLQILFPFNKRLNLKEFRTFEFFSHLFELKYEHCLHHYLLEKKWGIQCDAIVSDDANLVVSVHLTEQGLENIKKVKGAIFQYLKFLLDEWPRLGERKQPFFCANMSEMHDFLYAKYIAERFDVANDEYDERDLFGPLESSTDEQSLITSQIIENENVVYLIHTRETELVESVLGLGNDGQEKQLEEHFQTKFKVYETGLFKDTEPVSDVDFKIAKVDVDNSDTSPNNYSIAAFIFKPQDVVYQDLCRLYLLWYSEHIVSNPEKYGINLLKHCTMYGSERGLDTHVYDQFHRLQPSTMGDDDTFYFMIKIAMWQLSTKLTNSQSLARCLLDTAIENIYRNDKVDPIPMQYNTMRTMKRQHYVDHFKKCLHYNDDQLNEMLAKDMREYDGGVHVDIHIKSMNKNELLTVTYHFFICEQYDNRVEELLKMMKKWAEKLRNDLGLYSVHASTTTFGITSKTDGILLEAITLESNENQRCRIIQEHLKSMMENKHSLPKHLQPVHDHLMERQICIQIVGHEQEEDNGKFETDFSVWFNHYKEAFEALIDPAPSESESESTDEELFGSQPSKKLKPNPEDMRSE